MITKFKIFEEYRGYGGYYIKNIVDSMVNLFDYIDCAVEVKKFDEDELLTWRLQWGDDMHEIEQYSNEGLFTVFLDSGSWGPEQSYNQLIEFFRYIFGRYEEKVDDEDDDISSSMILELDKIPILIGELTPEEFDLFRETKKFNL